MKDDQSPPGSHEPGLAQHYRQYHDELPPASLDAAILAAAREHAVGSRRVGLLARLHAWLFAGTTGRRWSVALSGVAILGVGLGVSLRIQAPGVLPPDGVPLAADTLMLRRAEPHPGPARLPAPAPAISAMAEAAVPPAVPERDQALGQAREPAMLEPALLDALRQLVRLRERGERKEAEALAEDLRQRHPGLDIEAQLDNLPRGAD